MGFSYFKHGQVVSFHFRHYLNGCPSPPHRPDIPRVYIICCSGFHKDYRPRDFRRISASTMNRHPLYEDPLTINAEFKWFKRSFPVRSFLDVKMVTLLSHLRLGGAVTIEGLLVGSEPRLL